jgi:hypothetical protein
MKRILVVLTAAGLAISARGYAADAPSDPSDAKKDQLQAAYAQERLRREFAAFEQSLLTLAQRYEKSGKQEDREKAVVLRQAIELAAKEGIDNQFNKLVATLTASGVSLQDINAAIGQNEQLTKTLREMIDLLLTDNQTAKLKEEQRRLQDLLKRVDKIIREEKLERSKVESGRLDGDQLAKSQGKVTKDTKDLSKEMGNKKDAKDGKADPKNGKKGDSKDKPKDGQPKDGQPKDGQPKDGQPKDGQPKDGQPKNGQPKDAQPKDGQPKDGQPSDQQPKEGQKQQQQEQEEGTPGRKQVQDAVENQQDAEKNLKRNDKKQASANQDDAIKNLEDVRKEIERRLRQLREEEQLRKLANLEARCRQMLAMQIEVYEGTKRVHGTIQANEGQKPTRNEDLKAGELSAREGVIIGEANKALQLLEEDGTAVAVPQVLEQCRDDMKAVQARLFRTDVGTFTQQVEEEIIAALKEVIESLKRQQQQLKDQQNSPPPPPGQPPPDRLINILAELRMLRSLQVRVNQRTISYGKEFPGEQVDDAGVQTELRKLAERQVKIEKATKDIASGKTVGGSP